LDAGTSTPGIKGSQSEMNHQPTQNAEGDNASTFPTFIATNAFLSHKQIFEYQHKNKLLLANPLKLLQFHCRQLCQYQYQTL
jgi:hypothetical protein